MTRFIEQGRQAIREKELIQADTRIIFDTAINLLRANGKHYRDFVAFKHTGISHTVNSAEPPVNFWVSAGANLDKARSVWLTVQGHGFWLRIRKIGSGDRVRFEAKEQRSGYTDDAKLSSVEGHLESLRFVERELLPFPETE